MTQCHYTLITGDHARDKQHVKTIVSNLGTYFDDAEVDTIQEKDGEYSFTAGTPRREPLIELMGQHEGGVRSNVPRFNDEGVLGTVRYLITTDKFCIRHNCDMKRAPESLSMYNTELGLHTLLIHKFADIIEQANQRYNAAQEAEACIQKAMSEIYGAMNSEDYIISTKSYETGARIYINSKHIVAVTPDDTAETGIRIYTTGGHSFLVDARYFDAEWQSK